VAWVLKLVEDLGTVPAQYFQKMVGTQDLWEVRVNAGSDTYRLLGFHDGPRLVVLTHAFQKKTQKTPRQAIELAEERKQEYLERRKRK
jgi:phage-related protein